MTHTTLHAHAQSEPWNRSIGLYLAYISVQNGVRSIGEIPPVHVTMVPEDDSGTNSVSEPTMRLQPEHAQSLMDALWSAGIRPTEGAGSAGQLASTLRHLEDMRSLVFETPKPTTL